jgi:alanine-glyoxylate transaminase / serine-glyoxylate transaminase / serine-pyruvate transaminase
VVALEEPWGRIVPTERVAEALAAHPDARFVALVHAETSTGAHQPLEEVGALLADTDTLFLVDTVTGLGGVPLEVDAWHLDVVYSGTQKCLSVPPGLAPITFSPKAEAVLDRALEPVRSWYLDVGGPRYWGGERAYHHTAPISALLGLHEGLRLVLEEGLETRWARHAEVGELFQEPHPGPRRDLLAQEGHRLPQLTSFAWPDGVDEGRCAGGCSTSTASRSAAGSATSPAGLAGRAHGRGGDPRQRRPAARRDRRAARGLTHTRRRRRRRRRRGAASTTVAPYVETHV